MNQQSAMLSPRLALCADFVRQDSVVADIGTDHALLPIWLVSRRKARRAIASDVNKGPIARAGANIARYGMSGLISTVVADGLAGVDPEEVTDIVIAGMGGDLISTILDDAPWVRNNRYRLILQPMSHPERLREYLFAHGFRVEKEQAVEDSGRIYSVMRVSHRGSVDYTELMLYGGLLIGSDDAAARAYLSRTAAALRRKAGGLRTAGRSEEAEHLEAIADDLLKQA